MKGEVTTQAVSPLVPYCQICRKPWKNWTKLKTHYQNMHHLRRVFVCKATACECVFVSESQQFRHQRLHHNYQKCPICPLVFPSALTLKSHIDTHQSQVANPVNTIDLQDLQNVTERYLQKLRKRLQDCNLDPHGGLGMALKESLVQQASTGNEDMSWATLGFIVHAAEFAMRTEKRGAAESGRNPVSESSDSEPMAISLPSSPDCSPTSPVFHSETPPNHTFSQEIPQNLPCPWLNCLENFHFQSDLLCHLRTNHI